MTARMWFCFIAALAIIASLNGSPNKKKATRLDLGKVTVESNIAVKNATWLDSGKVTVKGNYITVNLHPERKVKTAISDIRKKLKSLHQELSALEKLKAKDCKFDFEDGIDAWTKAGSAFNNQPTYGDNPTARNRGQPANQRGHWWIGGAEKRSSKNAPGGRMQGDRPKGRLTSPPFKITGKHISFLIGGGCDIDSIRAELVIGRKVVKKETGKCHETMIRKYWDVGAFIGQIARVRLIDSSSDRWGHINFDDLKGDISCEENWNKISSVSSSSSEKYKDKKGQ